MYEINSSFCYVCSPWMQADLKTVIEDALPAGDQRNHRPDEHSEDALHHGHRNGSKRSDKVDDDTSHAGVEMPSAGLVRRRSMAALVSSTVVRQAYYHKNIGSRQHSLGSIANEGTETKM